MGRKSTADPNLFAKRHFDKLLEKLDPEAVAEQQQESQGKDLKAVEAGRKGGKKGGPARAKSLSPRRRKQIATKASRARWEK
jgi:hypothetical protein